MNKLNFIDLFCGCGGFSLGLKRAGLIGLAAIDFNSEAIAVFKKNLPEIPHILDEDLTDFAPSELEKRIGTNEIDVIVGGPPCQGFSTVRQVDGANNGKRLVDDERRHLYREFLRYVEFFQPKVFVMENVLGIRSASEGEYFTRVQTEARALGYRVHAQIEDCVDLGLPQKRRRQLFIGTRLGLPDYFRPKLKPAPRIDVGSDETPGLKAPLTLWEAIGDLPHLAAGAGKEDSEYDVDRFTNYHVSPRNVKPNKTTRPQAADIRNSAFTRNHMPTTRQGIARTAAARRRTLRVLHSTLTLLAPTRVLPL